MCCVDASFNFTMESEKQWHEKIYISLIYGFPKDMFHFQWISQCVCYFILFFSDIALGSCQVTHKEGILMNICGRYFPHLLLVPFFH